MARTRSWTLLTIALLCAISVAAATAGSDGPGWVVLDISPSETTTVSVPFEYASSGVASFFVLQDGTPRLHFDGPAQSDDVAVATGDPITLHPSPDLAPAEFTPGIVIHPGHTYRIAILVSGDVTHWNYEIAPSSAPATELANGTSILWSDASGLHGSLTADASLVAAHAGIVAGGSVRTPIAGQLFGWFGSPQTGEENVGSFTATTPSGPLTCPCNFFGDAGSPAASSGDYEFDSTGVTVGLNHVPILVAADIPPLT